MRRGGARYFVFCAILFSGCAFGPQIDVNASSRGDQIVFDIPHRGINGLLEFAVLDEKGGTLWSVDLNYERGTQITYGVLPKTGKQVHPPKGTKPPDIRGQTVIVDVHYQYDEAVPSAGSFRKTLNIP
jgi:hypothetical protein